MFEEAKYKLKRSVYKKTICRNCKRERWEGHPELNECDCCQIGL